MNDSKFGHELGRKSNPQKYMSPFRPAPPYILFSDSFKLSKNSTTEVPDWEVCIPLMLTNIRLTEQDIQAKHDNVLDLFYSGIKSEEGKRTMTGNLRKFLEDACRDLLEGDFEQRSQQFVSIVQEDAQRGTEIILAYVARLKEFTKLEKQDLSYLNPSTIPNKIKPIKKLLEMNNLGLGWKRIYTTFPEIDNTHKGRGYTREEIRKLLEYSNNLDTDFIILAMSSGSLRIGAWENITWKDIFPIYEKDGKYLLDCDNDEQNPNVVCAGMVIYKGTTEEYIALISIEAWKKLQEFKKIWTEKVGRKPLDSDYLLLARYSKPTVLKVNAIKKRLEKLVKKAGIRSPLTEGKRRHEVPATHGFRRYYDKIMMSSQKTKGTLSALVVKERLMGHGELIKTDKNYFWTEIFDLVPDYLFAMPELMINDEERLKYKLTLEVEKSFKLTQENNQNQVALEQLEQLKVKVDRLTRFQKT